MTDLSPERQRELLAAIGVSVVWGAHEADVWVIMVDGILGYVGSYLDALEEGAEALMWQKAWIMYADVAITHDWHAQADRIAALEAENAALRALEAERGTLDACQRIVAERDALRAQLAARTESDALVDALAGEYIDDAMDAVARLVGDPDMERVDAYDAFDYAHELARRAKAAREGGAP